MDAGVTPGADTANQVRTFLQAWFTAIQQHDRGWIEGHLANDFSDWLVPIGQPLSRGALIDLQMGMEEFVPNLLDLRVVETGGYVSALQKLTVREMFPPVERQSSTLQSALEGIKELLDGGILDPASEKPVVVNSVLRRREDGFEVIHHMLVGRAEVPAPVRSQSFSKRSAAARRS